jgi:TonB family protein
VIISTLLNGLWQGAPIVAIAFLLSRCIPERNATTRHALWFATLAALVVVPVLATVSNAGAMLAAMFRAHPGEAGYTVSLLPYKPIVEHADAWFAQFAAWIVAIWLIGVAINLLRLTMSLVRINRIRRCATLIDGSNPDVFASEDVAVPIVAGIFLPAIVIPKQLLKALAPLDLQSVIAHERAHIRRHDTISNLIQRLIEAWLFFNPWVRIAGTYLAKERESACDDWVVEKTGSPDEYAACLAMLAQIVKPKNAPILTPSAFRSRHALVARIERLGSKEPRPLTVNPYVVGGIVMLFAVLTLALQALSPALAVTPAAYAGSPSARDAASAVAAACAHPNSDALVVTAAPPLLPHGFKVTGYVTVAVTIAPSGRVVHTAILHSSGNTDIDNAVAAAARQSKYSPKIVNCTPVQGSYVFRADFAPNG